jgi:hypothetical protein
VVGRHSPGNPFDALPVGYNQNDALLFAAHVTSGASVVAPRVPTSRPTDRHLSMRESPMARSGGCNEGMSAEEMKMSDQLVVAMKRRHLAGVCGAEVAVGTRARRLRRRHPEAWHQSGGQM